MTARAAPDWTRSPLPSLRLCLALLPLCLAPPAIGAPAAGGAEYRDPEGRFTIALPPGFVEVPRPALEGKLGELRRAGAPVPAYQAAFDRGTEPRLSYPYALVEVVRVPGADWTAADLEGVLGRLNVAQAARETAAAFDRLGLGGLVRDPSITFVRYEPERQAGAFRIATRVRDAEVQGAGRVHFYREGYVALWSYYLAGSPDAAAAEQLAAGLTVVPAHRVPEGKWAGRIRAALIAVVLAAAGALAGLAVWRARRRRAAAL